MHADVHHTRHAPLPPAHYTLFSRSLNWPTISPATC